MDTIPGIDSLPDDASLLKEMVEGLYSTLEKKDQIIERLKHELLLLRHWRFGRKSEKLAEDGQLALFEQAPAVPETPVAVVFPDAEPEGKAKRQGHGRRSLPAELPVERVEIEPSAEERVCQPCGSDKVRIGEEIRRELDYRPGSIHIREYVRPVYACPHACEGQVTVAENRNDSPIEKGLPGPGLLAHVVTNKYADHIPLNRQEAMLARMGIAIGRSTMCGWMAEGAHLLTSFGCLIREEVMRSEVLHTDDTPVEVQDPSGKRGPKTGRLWVYRGDRRHPYLFYQYSPNHKREWPAGVLEGWKGYLQADAFPGYNGLYTGEDAITEVACWAHARRKFVEAQKSSPKGAMPALAHIGCLYRVEREVREECETLGIRLDDPGPDGDRAVALRLCRRQEKSIPLLDAFGKWLHGDGAVVLPKSPLGEAMGYCRKNWQALQVYAGNGELSIDNNPAEQALRPVAVGRKNYLFFGSDQGGNTAATLYSVIASAKRHRLDPWRYLRDLFTRLPRITVSKLAELLPDRWHDSHAAD